MRVPVPAFVMRGRDIRRGGPAFPRVAGMAAPILPHRRDRAIAWSIGPIGPPPTLPLAPAGVSPSGPRCRAVAPTFPLRDAPRILSGATLTRGKEV